jgi:hypothetical protein
MSIAELQALVPPPVTPFEVGTSDRWQEVEDRLGLKLPRDYKEFICAYGSGLFAGLYVVHNPFAASRSINLLAYGKRVCDLNRESRRSNPERFLYPYFPEPGGLFPWGHDENGNDYFWRTEGPPSDWLVVQDNNRGEGIRVQPHSMTDFLVAILRREVEALASGYPRSENFVFHPYRPEKRPWWRLWG